MESGALADVGSISLGIGLLVVVGTGLILAIRVFIARSHRAALKAIYDAIPPEMRELLNDMNADLRAIEDPDERRDAMVKRIRAGLAYLGEPTIEALPGGATRITGKIGGRAVLEITADGMVNRADAYGSFACGGVTLQSTGAHFDPAGLLHQPGHAEVDELLGQMNEVGVSSVRFEKDRISVSLAGSLYDTVPGEMTNDVGGLLSTLENAVLLWEHVEAESEADVPAGTVSADGESSQVDAVAAAFQRVHEDGVGDPGTLQVEACRLLFERVEDLLDAPKQVLDPNEAEQELRGQLSGAAVRLVVEDDGRFQIQAKLDVGGCCWFQYDPALEPVSPDTDDAFAEDDTVRVFVADGLYIEGGQEDVATAMEFHAAMEPADVERIRNALMELPLRDITFSIDELFVNGGRMLPDIDDPVATVRACFALLAELIESHGHVR